ncbi:MAG: M15 family metallopeptidase [Clostridia bacterium]|nr:M15 family metallopeptidase [Clostridia bacterium]
MDKNERNAQGRNDAESFRRANEPLDGPQPERRSDGSVIYSSAVDGERRPKRRVTKMSRKRYRKRNGALIALVIFFTLVIGASAILIIKNRKNETPSPSASVSDTASATDAPAPDESAPAFETTVPDTESGNGANSNNNERSVTLSNELIHDGDLILVNYKYAYTFPETVEMFNMKEAAEHYSVSTIDTVLRRGALDAFISLTNDLYETVGCDDVIVVSSFRSVEKQQEIYQDRLERFGSEYAAAYVAEPGYSEHHTGLAMDLSVYTDDGVSYDIETYPDCEWFMQNYDRYGYILRYPEHKAGITSINFEGWHYRYVGLPHSLIMDKFDLCLEEYIEDCLPGYTYHSALCYNAATNVIKTVDAPAYQLADSERLVYFVPASSGDTTSVPVTDAPYTVSGNNVDGFVVTLG